MQKDETYLNHPTFGLLFRICLIEEGKELFTTLYAQRLFFIVTQTGLRENFAPLTRGEARLLVEGRMRHLRRLGSSDEYERLNTVYRQTFQ